MEHFFEDNFKLLMILSLVWCALVVLVSIIYRARKRKRKLGIPEFELTFSEKRVSGFSHKSTLTKLGGTSNCLVIELSRNALVIRAMFPFNLMFLPEFYDLEHYIPKDKIKRVQPEDNEGQGHRVLIEFEEDGREKRVELILRKRQEFLRALGSLPEAHPVPSGIFT